MINVYLKIPVKYLDNMQKHFPEILSTNATSFSTKSGIRLVDCLLESEDNLKKLISKFADLSVVMAFDKNGLTIDSQAGDATEIKKFFRRRLVNIDDDNVHRWSGYRKRIFIKRTKISQDMLKVARLRRVEVKTSNGREELSDIIKKDKIYILDNMQRQIIGLDVEKLAYKQVDFPSDPKKALLNESGNAILTEDGQEIFQEKPSKNILLASDYEKITNENKQNILI